jgi:hypothetical protein
VLSFWYYVRKLIFKLQINVSGRNNKDPSVELQKTTVPICGQTLRRMGINVEDVFSTNYY